MKIRYIYFKSKETTFLDEWTDPIVKNKVSLLSSAAHLYTEILHL